MADQPPVTGDPRPGPGRRLDPGSAGPPAEAAADFEAVQSSAEFTRLRRTFRRFAFPMTVAFIVWYMLYVLLSTYAVGFMSTPVIGHINLGLLLGLGQFVTTFVITGLYVRYANREIDPLATELRGELESRIDPEELR